MSSERDNRARAAARARLERQMAARREAMRRKRLLQARIAGGVAGLVVLGAVVWIIVAATGGGEPTAGPAGPPGPCVYKVEHPQPTAAPVDPTASPDPSATPEATPTQSPLPEGVQDVGLPPSDPPSSGYQVLTFDTNLGVIEVEMDLSRTRCTSNALAYLANQGFYDHDPDSDVPSCHRIVPGIFALQCGDPSGTGYGGPNFRYDDEYLPADRLPAYREGDVAMANAGPAVDGGGTNSSQFFFVYGPATQLPANYTVWGRVISGMDVVKQVAAAGYDPETEMSVGGGAPTVDLIFNKVTAGPVTDTPAVVPTTTAPATESPAPATS